MNAIEGQISISLFPGRKNGARVEVSSSRPLQAAKILIGKTPEQALATIPLLFNICGTAQARVALLAMQQHLDLASDTGMESARDMLVLVENAREHLLRLFIDWPKLFDLETDNDNLPYLGQVQNRFKNALFAGGNAFSLDSRLQAQPESAAALIDGLEDYLRRFVFGCSTRQWLDIHDIDGLHRWAGANSTLAAQSVQTICEQGWASQGLSRCPPLPALDTAELTGLFEQPLAERFIAEPQWQGHCCETTALSRQLDQPLLQALQGEFQTTLITRWVARLVELARIPRQLKRLLERLPETGRESRPAHENGLASIEAARGRLIHRVRIEQGRIENYQILAPTEWNFHPRGLVAQTLGSIAASEHSELDTLAHIMINAIDPCVGYELRIH